ncbi:MAG TPA: HNH endonuclease signature motif containing protein [Zoogloea sp.]|nr:HNH endonuclease signature motif containing protein [Zoogloea sp.]
MKPKVRGLPRIELPSLEYLQECFDYNPETGLLFWKARPLHHFLGVRGRNSWNARFAGKEAGNRYYRNGEKEYRSVGITSPEQGRLKIYSLHLIAMKMLGQTVQEGQEVDHINHDKWDNRAANLRVCSATENVRNTRGHVAKKSRLPKGVFMDRNLICAKITVDRVKITLGYFKTPEEAHQCYKEHADRLHREFACYGREKAVPPTEKAPLDVEL